MSSGRVRRRRNLESVFPLASQLRVSGCFYLLFAGLWTIIARSREGRAKFGRTSAAKVPMYLLTDRRVAKRGPITSKLQTSTANNPSGGPNNLRGSDQFNG
jgi:hypothetical protein